MIKLTHTHPVLSLPSSHYRCRSCHSTDANTQTNCISRARVRHPRVIRTQIRGHYFAKLDPLEINVLNLDTEGAWLKKNFKFGQ